MQNNAGGDKGEGEKGKERRGSRAEKSKGIMDK
jgi:hypothetical protein